MGDIIAGRQVRFNPDVYVRHLRSGRLYKIKYGPESAKLENENTPCYIFVRIKLFNENIPDAELNVLRVISAAAMEKNFILAPEIGLTSIDGPGS